MSARLADVEGVARSLKEAVPVLPPCPLVTSYCVPSFASMIALVPFRWKPPPNQWRKSKESTGGEKERKRPLGVTYFVHVTFDFVLG